MASPPAPDLRRAALWAGLAWLTCCVVLIWLAHGRFSALAFRDPEQLLVPPKQPDIELWGAFHLPVVGAAIGLATIIAHTVHNAVVAWALVGFVATATYLLVTALQYLVAERRADRRKLNLPDPKGVAEKATEEAERVGR